MNFRYLMSLVLFFLSLGSITHAQQQVDLSPVIQGINAYRSFLLKEDSTRILKLRLLLDKMDHFELSKEEIDNFCTGIVTEASYFKNDVMWVKEFSYKLDSVYRQFVEAFTEQDLEILVENANIINLINDGFISNRYPYIISRKAPIFWEMQHYNIQENMRIAEIGAGQGVFSLILALSYPSIELYINDIIDFSMHRIQENFSTCPLVKNQDRIHPVKGEKKSTLLDGKELDMIIIRNSFHHFSKKGKMLASIKSALKKEGELFIVDPVKEMIINKEKACKKVMSHKAILKHLSKNGFRLVEKDKGEWMMMMKFVKA